MNVREKVCAYGRGVVALAIVAGLTLMASAATYKTWPANYWASMVAAETAQRPVAATASLALMTEDADVIRTEASVSELDTFLSGVFPASNSLLGLSTMPFGLLLFVR